MSNVPYRMLRTPAVSVCKCSFDCKQYIEVKEQALKVSDYWTLLKALNQLAKHLKIFGHYHATPLLEAIEKSTDH